MLLGFGDGPVRAEWQVEEKVPPGFSRVYWVQGGEVWYEDEKTSQKLQRDRLYLFPSASCFRMWQNPENPLVCTFLHLDLFPTLVQKLTPLPFLPDGVLLGLLQTVQASIRSGQTRLTAMLADVLEEYLRQHEILTPPVLEISKVLLYIAQHVREKIRIGDLSRLSGYNPQYFIRLFKESVGMPPYQYVVNFRMTESVKLLKDGALTVARIAEMVGYPDAKSFDRAFREKYGVSPGKFRKFYVPLP